MKKVTSRNLIGGFLGGAIGILSSWYVAPAFLPLGVLIGVVLGWWNEDIVQLFREAHRQAKKAATGLVSIFDQAVASLTRLCGMSTKAAGVSRWIIAKAIVGSFVAIISSSLKLWNALVRFTKWTARHQVNQVYVIDITIYLSFILVLPAIAFLIEPYFGISGGNRGILTMATAVATWGGSMIYRMQHEAAANTELSELCQFYREWEVISHHGWFVYLLYTIGQHVRYSIGTALFATIAGPWFLGMAMVGFIGVYPLIAAIAFARGFYNLASQAGHWMCLGVTMAVTGILWPVYHQSFADPRVLWIVALGAGIASGGLTEVIRRVMLPFYENTAVGRQLTAKEGAYDIAISGEDDKDYMGVMIFKIGGLWARQNRLGRMFRFVCFGFPVARPA